MRYVATATFTDMKLMKELKTRQPLSIVNHRFRKLADEMADKYGMALFEIKIEMFNE